MSEQYQPTPRQPRLIWSGRDKRRESEPLPAQTVEVIRPFHAKADESLRLFQGESDIPENRLIWTNDNLVALTSLLHGDEQHAPLEGKVDLVYIDPPFAVQSDFKINVEIENGVSDEKLPTVIEELAYNRYLEKRTRFVSVDDERSPLEYKGDHGADREHLSPLRLARRTLPQSVDGRSVRL